MIDSLRTVAFFLLLTQPVLAAADVPDKWTVLDRIVEAYGGEENLRKLDSMVQEWDMVALMGNRHGSDVRSIRVPGQLRVELKYPEKTEIRILDGTRGWYAPNGAPAIKATVPQRNAMRLQLMRLYSPLVLRDRADAIALTVEGEFCALSLVEGDIRADYLVNQDNWHIEKAVGTLTVNGNEMQFLTEYSDFAFVDGALIHHRENKYAGKVNTAVLKLRKITFDAEFGNGTFGTR